jgi:hypothetical protein
LIHFPGASNVSQWSHMIHHETKWQNKIIIPKSISCLASEIIVLGVKCYLGELTVWMTIGAMKTCIVA